MSENCVRGHWLIGKRGGGAMDEHPKIYRAFVPGSIRGILVVALEKPNKNTSHIALFAQHVLNLPSCRDVGSEWPFQDIIPLQRFLEDLHPSLASWSECALYIQHQTTDNGTVHALGLGPDKVLQKRAALLGLTLCALLSCEDAQQAYPDFAGEGASFAQEVAMSRKIQVQTIRPQAASSGALPSKRPFTAFDTVSAKQSTVPEGVKLPEASLLKRWQGIRVPWMPDRPDELLQMKDVKHLERVPEATFMEILSRARASFEEEIRRKSGRDRRPDKGRFFFDLTKSFRPWPCIIAAHSERARIVGNGIKSFRLVMDESVPDPSAKGSLLFFEVKQHKGQIHEFHSLARTHETMRRDRTKDDVNLAFQMAFGKGTRSDALGDLVHQFQAEQRRTGWKPDDFLQRQVHQAWAISTSLQQDFTSWLVQRQPTAATSPAERSLRDCMLSEWEKSQAHRFGKLDPAVTPAALHRFRSLVETFSSDDDNVRCSHESISDRFLHGHRNKTIEDLMSELRLGTTDALEIPPLVAVRHQEVFYVIMGNRRLYAYQNCGEFVLFNMIVHKFPEFHGTDPAEREALTVKTLQAASTTTAGQQVEVRRSQATRKIAVKARPKRPVPDSEEQDLCLQPCPKPKPEKKAMPRPAKKARPQPAQKAMPRPMPQTHKPTQTPSRPRPSSKPTSAKTV